MMKRTFIAMGFSFLLLLFLFYSDSKIDPATTTNTLVNTASVNTTTVNRTTAANNLDGTWVTVVQEGLHPQEVVMVISNNAYRIEKNGSVQAEGRFEIVGNQMVSTSTLGNTTYDFEMAQDGQSFTLASAIVYQKRN